MSSRTGLEEESKQDTSVGQAGIPVWLVLCIASFLAAVILGAMLYREYQHTERETQRTNAEAAALKARPKHGPVIVVPANKNFPIQAVPED